MTHRLFKVPQVRVFENVTFMKKKADCFWKNNYYCFPFRKNIKF